MIRLKKHSIVVLATKKMHCDEGMENQYEKINITGTSIQNKCFPCLNTTLRKGYQEYPKTRSQLDAKAGAAGY